MQIVSTDPEPLKLALYLVRPRTTVHQLLRILAIARAVATSVRLQQPVLARHACFAPRFSATLD